MHFENIKMIIDKERNKVFDYIFIMGDIDNLTDGIDL